MSRANGCDGRPGRTRASTATSAPTGAQHVDAELADERVADRQAAEQCEQPHDHGRTDARERLDAAEEDEAVLAGEEPLCGLERHDQEDAEEGHAGDGDHVVALRAERQGCQQLGHTDADRGEHHAVQQRRREDLRRAFGIAALEEGHGIAQAHRGDPGGDEHPGRDRGVLTFALWSQLAGSDPTDDERADDLCRGSAHREHGGHRERSVRRRHDRRRRRGRARAHGRSSAWPPDQRAIASARPRRRASFATCPALLLANRSNPATARNRATAAG